MQAQGEPHRQRPPHALSPPCNALLQTVGRVNPHQRCGSTDGSPTSLRHVARPARTRPRQPLGRRGSGGGSAIYRRVGECAPSIGGEIGEVGLLGRRSR